MAKKTELQQIKVSPQWKEKIEKAAALRQENLSEFIRIASEEKANITISQSV